MWKSLVYLIFLNCCISLGEEYFDCRRQGQDCANNKTCQNDGTCDCGNDYTGYNCELQKSLSGSSPCTNQTDSCGSDGGICYNDNGNNACFCPPGFYGDHCEYKRYDVTCQKSYMLIVVNPAGTFSGVVYAKDENGCTFSKSDLPAGKQGVAVSVKDSDCGGVTQVNESRSRDVIIQFSEKHRTNLDIKLSVTCGGINNDATVVTVTSVITSNEAVRSSLNITKTVNSIDSSLVQFNINLKDGSSVSESGAVSLDEQLTFEFTANFTSAAPEKIADVKPVSVRLVDGNTTKEGRLEVLYQGTWGTLRAKYLFFHGATAVCRTLGFTNAFGLPRGKGFFPAGSGRILRGFSSCSGLEQNVDECARWKITECGNPCKAHEVGIICDENPTPYKLKLVDGPNEHEGKLQVFDDDKWNWVCKTSLFKIKEAKVVCRQLGYAKAELIDVVDAVTGDKWKYDVHCFNYETGIHFCILSERDQQSGCPYANIKCLDDLSNIELQLVDGPSNNYGIVEVNKNNEWSKVYNKYPSEAVANVICRTLGFNDSKPFISTVQCTGLEKNINECVLHFQVPSKKQLSLALLYAEESSKIKIRLVNGSSEREGRVEIKYLGMWGTVCDKYHTDYNAAVYCRMLGFTNSNATAVNQAHFGEGSGPILLRFINCLGNETSLEQCKFEWGNFKCDHGNDAGVICAVPAEPEAGTLRIESCTADNQKTGEDTETLKIIENSCPSSEIGKLMIQEPERSGNNVTFKLKAFTFNKNNIVSTECSIKVCPPDQKSLCDPVDCNGKQGFGRKRRSAETFDELVRKTFTVLDVMVEDRTPSISQKPAEQYRSDEVDVNNTILIVPCVVMVIIFSLVIGIVVIVFLRKKKPNQKKEDVNKHHI